MVLHFCEQAALRKICSVCGTEGIRPIDHRQLVELQLMDSFLICSNTDEDFVWTVQGNLLTHCCCFLCCFLFICSHTDEVFEQFMATCWLIFFFLICSHADKDFVRTVQGNLLTHFCLFVFVLSVHTQVKTLFEQFKATCWLFFFFFFISSHTDEDFEQFKATCWLIFFQAVLTQMRTLHSWRQSRWLIFFQAVLTQMRTLHSWRQSRWLIFFQAVLTQMRTLHSWRQSRWLIFHLFSCWWGLCLNSSRQLVDSFFLNQFCYRQGLCCLNGSRQLVDSFLLSVLTQMWTLIEQFKAKSWTHFSSVLMQMRTLFEQFKATCCSFFICSHTDENCLNSWRQLIDVFLHIFMQTMTFLNS